MKYFFDTYAIIELQKDSPTFSQIDENQGITCIFNLAEAYYVLKTQFSQGLAEKALAAGSAHLGELTSGLIKKAMDFRAGFNSKNRKSALSYADAIGYTYALENDLEFVTGDDAFRGLKGVRFLK